ncbi:hypothetical protein lmo4a_0114 [Listeria monocytogenes L99]|nr:hypothetical protein lmo4a_0114 [Listeria monocytogenes L99]
MVFCRFYGEIVNNFNNKLIYFWFFIKMASESLQPIFENELNVFMKSQTEKPTFTQQELT